MAMKWTQQLSPVFKFYYVLSLVLPFKCVYGLSILEPALSAPPDGPVTMTRLSTPGVSRVDRTKAFHRYGTLPLHAEVSEVSLKAAQESSSEFVVVKDFNLKSVRVIDDVVVECFDASSGDCDYTLTEYDKRMLSLYASFIENSGDDLMDVPYSLGLLRDKDSEYTMGMYSTNYGGTANSVAYWLRLHFNDGSKVYDHDTSLAKVLAVLELSVHERAHHTYAGGHDDTWQVYYNTYYHRAVRNLDQYTKLAEHILEETVDCAEQGTVIGWVLGGGAFLVVGMFILLW